ncbi:hypothetical protein Cni_G06442 [Canna indica]|uniref:Uncharacterized protein n=1 Tax=Canna indica TaxID=4628 RepID=A0AAQ3Q6J5_9LILI|nr:hypothetical protein Cni_G06442 [Canna indica]
MTSTLCSRVHNSKILNRKWVAQKIHKAMTINKNLKFRGIVEEVRQNYFVDITLSKAVRAIKIAKQRIEGDVSKQYEKLYEFCSEIRMTNPRSTTIMKTESTTSNARQRHFQRINICLKPVVIGFLTSRRPILDLDGCFLKGT